MIGVSSWFFPSGLFRRYRAPVAGVVSLSHRIRHGRCRAHFVPQSIQLRTLVGAHSRGEHVGAFAFVVGLTVGELAPVSAVAVVVKVRGWGGQVGPGCQ